MSQDSTLDELEFFAKNPIAEASGKTILVTLVGPIRWWWGGRWNSPEHRAYVNYRDAVRLALASSPNIAVYSPHRAIQGAWTNRLQAINDNAIRMSDVVVDLTPFGPIVAAGTYEELRFAQRCGVSIVHASKGFGVTLTPEQVVSEVLLTVSRP